MNLVARLWMLSSLDISSMALGRPDLGRIAKWIHVLKCWQKKLDGFSYFPSR